MLREIFHVSFLKYFKKYVKQFKGIITWKILPLPSWSLVKNFLSIVVAATEMNQGARCGIVLGPGPELPAL